MDSAACIQPLVVDTADIELRQLLAEADCGQVHSRYRSTLNLLLAGTLVTLTSNPRGGAPRTAVLAAPAVLPQLAPGQAVTIAPNLLQTGAVQISFAAAQWRDYSLKIDATWQPNPAAIEIATHVSQRFFASFSPNLDSLASLSLTRALAGFTQLLQQLQQLQQLLQRDAAAAKAQALSQLADTFAALIGLGPGLTPIADDLICGLVLTMSLPHSPLQQLRQYCQPLIARYSQQTTEVSAAFLSDALAGRARQQVLDALTALFVPAGGANRRGVVAPYVTTNAAAASTIENTFMELANLGHTSGAAILKGVIAGVRALPAQCSTPAVAVQTALWQQQSA